MDNISGYNRYLSFNETEFILDAYFQDWIMHPDQENTLFWTGFLNTYPNKKADTAIARAFLMNLKFTREVPDDGLIRNSLTTHLESIEKVKEKRKIKGRQVHLFTLASKVAAMAGAVILMVSALVYYNTSDEKVLVKTDFGKLRSITLPDSSRIILNAKSILEFTHNWKQGAKREVWLTGEAFFEVKHLNRDVRKVQPAEQFLVHTHNLTITVLGTSFNIRERRGKTEVVLQTGKISIAFNHTGYPVLVMKPGDMVTYDPGVHNVLRNAIVAENYTAWKDNKLILYNPTINRLVEYLEDNFGKKIILQKPEMGAMKIEGPILFNNLDDALFIISTVMHADVIKNDSTIRIRPR